MRTLDTFSIAVAMASIAFSGATLAQANPAAADKPAMAASMPYDCKMMQGQGDAKAGMGMGMSKDMACASDPAASAGKAKKRLRHDHAKIHKNQ